MKSSLTSGSNMTHSTGRSACRFLWDMGWPADGEDIMELLGSTINGGKSGKLLRHPVQGPPRGHTWKSSNPHRI